MAKNYANFITHKSGRNERIFSCKEPITLRTPP